MNHDALPHTPLIPARESRGHTHKSYPCRPWVPDHACRVFSFPVASLLASWRGMLSGMSGEDSNCFDPIGSRCSRSNRKPVGWVRREAPQPTIQTRERPCRWVTRRSLSLGSPPARPEGALTHPTLLRLTSPMTAFQAGPPFGYTPQESGWRASRLLAGACPAMGRPASENAANRRISAIEVTWSA